MDKRSTNILKGIAIILIVLHNFLHWTMSIGENELRLDINVVHRFLEVIKNNPKTLLNASFSFLGHYGVQLFIFVSGYGLAMKYKNTLTIDYKKYIIYRVIKLYSLVFLGVICYFIMFFKDIQIKEFIKWVGTVLSMTNNFSYDRIFLNVGPWWYFSLALQLYLIYPIFHKIIFKGDIKTLIITLLSIYLLIYMLFPGLEIRGIPLFGNFLGHLPEFLLGIAFVKYPPAKIDYSILILCLFIFLLSNFYQTIFPFSFLSITILLLYIYHFVLKFPEVILNILSYIGEISMFIFVINGPVRAFTMPYLVFENNPIKTFIGSITHFLVVVIVSIALSYIYKLIFRFKNI